MTAPATVPEVNPTEPVEPVATEPTPETTPVPEVEPTEPEVTPDPLQDVERDTDGNFVLRVNDHTAYKGSTLKELFENAKNGYAAKDDYILKLKTTAVKEPERKPETKEDVLLPPSSQKVLQDVVQELGVQPEMLNWTKEDWRLYENEHGGVIAADAYQSVKAAKNLAQTRLDEQNIDFINKQTLEDETAEVRQLLKEFEVNPEDFDYRKVLETVYADDNAWKNNGVRKNGVIVRAAAKAIRDIAKSKMEKTISQTKDDELAKARLDKSKVTSETKTKATVDIPKKIPMSIAEAHKQLKEELRGQT